MPNARCLASRNARIRDWSILSYEYPICAFNCIQRTSLVSIKRNMKRACLRSLSPSRVVHDISVSAVQFPGEHDECKTMMRMTTKLNVLNLLLCAILGAAASCIGKCNWRKTRKLNALNLQQYTAQAVKREEGATYGDQVSRAQEKALELGGDGEGGNVHGASDEKTAILFVHFSKSGGSSVCWMMTEASRQKVLPITDVNGRRRAPIQNCNVELTSPLANRFRYENLMTCRHLIPYTMDKSGVPFRRNNFLSVEIPLEEQLPCPGFRSFAVMRRPVDRFISQVAEGKRSRDQIKDTEVNYTRIIDERRPNKSMKYVSGSYSSVNSMVIRQLLGKERYMDMRPIDQGDFEKAKTIVDKFDAFVPLEYLTDSRIHGLLVQKVPEFAAQSILHKRKNYGYGRSSFSSEFLERIESENKFDIMLYEYMLQKLGIA